MKTATKLRELHDFRGTAFLYQLSEPHEGHSFIASSAVDAVYSGPETYLFGCDAEGVVQDWRELDGSFRGSLDCDRAVRNAGYEILEGK